jgi:CheY-like chemotaxis protein
MPNRQVILLAEDLEDDIILIRRAFEKAGINNPLHVVRNGEEAIAYLSGFGKYAFREEYPLPDLLLLDLKMPGIDGFDVLRWIKQQPELYNLRVVVLTASDRIRDAEQAYRLGADSFMVKALDFQDTLYLAKTITEYWLNKYPETSGPRPAQFHDASPNPPSTP